MGMNQKEEKVREQHPEKTGQRKENDPQERPFTDRKDERTDRKPGR